MKTKKILGTLIIGGIIMILSHQLSCKVICDIISAADLIIEDISTTHSSTEQSGVTYQIVHLTLNTIEGIACPDLQCKGAETAGNHKYTQNIYYSENDVSNWGNPVDSYDFNVNELEPCAEAQNSAVYKFLVDGYYLIEGIVDTYNTVNERNENNNTLNGDFSSKKKSITGYNSLIIYVNNGLKPTQYKNNGEIKYVERIEAKTTYFNN